MRFAITVHGAGSEPSDVVVEVDDQATVAQLRESLAHTLGMPPAGDMWVGGGLVSPEAVIEASPIRDGARVALTPDFTKAPFTPPTRGWALHVVSGRDAGLIHAIPVGDHVLGRSGLPEFTDRSMSRRHAILRVTQAGATIADLGSANGTTIDGVKVPVDAAENEPPVPVLPGQIIGIGDTLAVIYVAHGPDAAVEVGAAGTVAFTRPPRLRPSRRPVRVSIPTKPVGRPPRKIPLAGVLAPLVMGGAMAAIEHQPTFLLFTAMSPIMAVSNVASDRRSSSKQLTQDLEKYREDLATFDERLATGLATETTTRRLAHPDAASILLTATLPGRRLWERRRHDDDAYDLRLGTADLPARLELVEERGTARPETDDTNGRTVFSVPVDINLRKTGVLGVAGPPDDVRGLVRWLVAQLAVNHGPRDLAITVIAPRAGQPWNWVRWLPHARPVDADAAVASIGNDAETIGARVTELAATVKARREAAKAGHFTAADFPAEVVIVEGARSLRAIAGLAFVFAEGPSVGVFAICVDAEERLLPEECTATLVLDEQDPAKLTVRRSGEDDTLGVLAEQMSVSLAETIARALAPVRDVSSDEDDVSLPDSARLLDVLTLEPPTPEAIRARWQLEGRSTTMAIGYGGEGRFALDLRRDGPHGLIAGTTGSGKSELLQTIIASLAVSNRPDSMNFVLIDYKGGSAFKDCVALPHTVGMVTDLDAHLVERALISLGAELKRREHQLADAGMKDIEDYIDLMARQPGLEQMPRLLIVIDEFASMARELPDFVTGLVNIAQRGRSLGIHLLLATQRPSGVVSPEIRANTNLRISLRVTDAADSSDVLDSAEASRIPKSAPGRGYVRLGAGALQPFQSGRVGGRRPGVRPAHAPAPFVAVLGWGQLGYATPRPERSVIAEDAELTDLSVLVSAITQAAEAEHLDHQRTPWLPALPDDMLLADVPAVREPVGASLTPLVFGVQDLPAEQAREAAAFDPSRDGHLIAAGAPRSGRSQLLRTIAASASLQAVADLHLYGLDCGNGSLLALTELPHCGAIVGRTQVERAQRLMARLMAELERRQALLSEQGVADIAEQRRGAQADDRLPYLMLLIDRWEGFTTTLGEVDSGRLLDIVLTLMREGASVGMHVLITGDRSLINGRIASLTERKIAFRLPDRNDYSLIGLRPRAMPEEVVPGRAFTAESGMEIQVALLDTDPSGQAQAAALAELGRSAKLRCVDTPKHLRPFRVDILPSRIGFEEAWGLRGTPISPEAVFALVGVGGDDLAALGPHLGTSPGFVVAGPNKSGRSTLLSVMARSLLRDGNLVMVAAPRPGPLRDLGGTVGVVDVVTDPLAPVEVWQAGVDAASAAGHPLTIIIDDGEALKESPAGEFFRSILKGAGPVGVSLVLGGHTDGICTGLSGWQVDAKKSRSGVLLSPQGAGDGDLIGLRLPRGLAGGKVQPGRGLLHLGNGSLTTVAIPA